MKYLRITNLESKGSSLILDMNIYLDLGAFFIMFGSGGLNPKAVAGGPSVTRLT